ncbi:helix-turn-helix domain-containing protein [Streptomyces alkaliphilus]|uniref:Helix-turn-helix domain-containing protein n=2 Tax=Streptomyces alkaliphilus TaxID=1472722 RepID=A0A7W3TC86_9ACTN|nr:helix-turn-helix domain-containing protein [Streptomyces alkaliphilus]MBB0244082.1 helix-turn-helix domain-containing protein [Streptomyces alkaliphilus]
MPEHLNRAMDHIEERLSADAGAPIDVADLARIAMTSEYHFRRLFSALAGMPLSEYIRRRRLTLAAAEVTAGKRTLLEVAVRHGYGSGEAFARAFRAVHGVGPAEARRAGASLRFQPRMAFHLVVEGSDGMRYRVVEKPAFSLVGRRARVPLVHEGVNPAIAEFVRGLGQETHQRIEALSDREPRGVISGSVLLSEDRTEGTELDYHQAAATGAEPPADMDVLPVAAGTWAVFESSGPFPLTLQYTWRDVFTRWFPSNPYRSVPGPELLRVELSEDGARADAEIWIPVTRTDTPPS